MCYGFMVLKMFSQFVCSQSFSGYSISGFKLKQWVLLLTESLLVKLDAKVNAMKYSPLQEMKEKESEDVTMTVPSG